MTYTTPLLAQAPPSNAALVTFLLYTMAVLGLAILSNRFRRGTNFLSEYFLGSRSLGMWAFALTFAATSASGGSFTGFPSLIYSHGWVLALWIASYMLVPALMMGLMGKRLNQMARRADAITIPDVMCARFGSRVLGTLSTVLIIFFLTFNLVAQFKSGALMLSTLLDDKPMFQSAVMATQLAVSGIPLLASVDSAYLLCLVFFSVAVIIYTAYGGFRAVVWTDVLQGIVMVFGVILLLPLVLAQVGGLQQATEDLHQMVPPRYRSVQVQCEDAPETDLPVPKGTWVEMPASNGSPRRVFRTAATATIAAGETLAFVLNENDERTEVPVLEIRSPHEVERIQTTPSLRVQQVVTHVRIERSEAADSLRSIPANTTIHYVSTDGSAARNYRTLEACEIAGGEVAAKVQRGEFMDVRVRALQVADPSVDAESNDVSVASVFGDYVSGDNQTGVYVMAPGPSASDAAGFLPLGVAISFFFFWTFSGAGQPSNMVRLMSFDSSLTLRRAMMMVAIYFSLIYFPLVVIFCCARVLLPGMETESDRIMPALAEHVTMSAGMPWLAGLLVAAPFAAVMSTVDSFLLMISSAIVRDVYQRDIHPDASEKTIKRLTYGATVLVGVVALLGALNPPEYLQNIIVFTGGGLSTSFLIPVTLALYWPRFNTAGAMAGMLAGFCSHVLTYLIGWWVYGGFQPIKIAGFHPFLPELVMSLVAALVVAKWNGPPSEALVRRFFGHQR